MDITGENCIYDKGKVLEKYYTGDESCNAYTEKYECGGEYNNNYGDVNGCEDHLCFWSCIKCKYKDKNMDNDKDINIKTNVNSNSIILTDEQELMIQYALNGYNVLVDACIGSGKTTSIQELCNRFPSNKNILYLTYNALLKTEARRKIKNINVDAHNYHAFCFSYIIKRGIKKQGDEQIHAFLELAPPIKQYDIIIIDEYQDISELRAKVLDYIVNNSINKPQIIAVGDLCQKIYDNTSLDVSTYIKNLLGNSYKKLEYTTCFRLNESYANYLGKIWHKTIKGINNDCKVLEMYKEDVIELLSKSNPKDILCLYPWKTCPEAMQILNIIESKYSNIYNKNTVYATIRDEDSAKINTDNAAIFTTFDASKGLERPISILCGFTSEGWTIRTQKDNINYEIIRNIFLVGASRGKHQIIMVIPDNTRDEILLDNELLSKSFEKHLNFKKPFNPSNMFDFKYDEDIQECINLIKYKDITDNKEPLNIKTSQGFLDISPCIGIWLEADYFTNYNIDKMIMWYFNMLIYSSNNHAQSIYKIKSQYNEYKNNYKSIEEQIAFLTSLETHQNRYRTQIDYPFLSNEEKIIIRNRLASEFSPNEDSQHGYALKINCKINSEKKEIIINGKTDIVKNNYIYELKFKSVLEPNNFLQLATYLVCANIKYGILWNIRDNEKYLVSVPNKKKFLTSVVKCITKTKEVTISSYEYIDPKTLETIEF